MRFRDWKTKADWDQLFTPVEEGTTFLKATEGTNQQAQERLHGTLLDLLSCDHLLVLCGAGTSLTLNPEGLEAAAGEPAPTMTSLWQTVKQRIEAREVGLFQKVLNYVNYTPAKNKENVEHLVACCKVSEQFRSTPWVKDFLEQAEMEIAQRCRFPEPDTPLPVHVKFLQRVTNRPLAKPRTRLFTTNYDLCFERAATQGEMVALDGFSHSLPQQFDVSFYDYDWVRRDAPAGPPAYYPRLFHLYKLHGSVDWERRDSVVVRNPAATRPLLAYPGMGQSELALESPLLDILARFQSALRQPNSGLLTIGHGFHGHHLSQPILQALRYNLDLRLICALSSCSIEDNPFLNRLNQLIHQGHQRVTLLQATFAELTTLLPKSLERPLPQETSQPPASILPKAA